MKKVIVLQAVLLLNVFVVFSQEKFFKIYTNNGYDYGEGVVQLSDSSYLVTGSSSSFNDSQAQAFLLKLDKNGEYVWSHNYGGTESDWGRRVLNWNDSIFYVTGYSNSLGTGSYNAYLVKTDKDGNELLQKHYIQPGWDKINDALFTADSMIYMVGETAGTTNGDNNYYIIKTNHNGDTLWTRNFGSAGEDALQSIQQYDATTFFAVGNHFNADSTFSKGAIIKFDANGNILFDKEFGPNGNYYLNDFFIRAGFVHAIGQRIQPITNEIDEYRVKVTLAGNLQWEASDNSQGASYYDHVMPFGTGGKVFVSSHFNTPFSVAGSYDASITRFYDNLIWDAAFVSVGFPGDDNNQEVALTNDESVVVVGFMTMPGMGGSSLYVYKVGPNADFPLINYSDITANDIHSLVTINEVETEIKGLRVYPNPTSSLINFQTIVPLTLHVVDINGRLIENYSIENGSTLDTTDWLKGLYYLSLSDEEGHSNHIKLIVQ
jgi:hypothetical protein